MALYKHGQYLTKSEDAAFDAVHKPGHVRLHKFKHGLHIRIKDQVHFRRLLWPSGKP